MRILFFISLAIVISAARTGAAQPSILVSQGESPSGEIAAATKWLEGSQQRLRVYISTYYRLQRITLPAWSYGIRALIERLMTLQRLKRLIGHESTQRALWTERIQEMRLRAVDAQKVPAEVWTAQAHAAIGVEAPSPTPLRQAPRSLPFVERKPLVAKGISINVVSTEVAAETDAEEKLRSESICPLTQCRLVEGEHGADMVALQGSQRVVKAIAAGTVVSILEAAGGYNVIVEHSGGYRSIYRGLAEVTVERDDVVSPGASLGTLTSEQDTLGFGIKHRGVFVEAQPWLKLE